MFCLSYETSTSCLLDGDREIAEYDGTGATLLRRYVYGPGIDEPVLRVEVNGLSLTRYYTHQDALGSVVAVTDSSGAVAEKDSYGVYGESLTLAGNSRRQKTGLMLLILISAVHHLSLRY
ncbi:hypothetical protein DBT53_004425, partial [Aerococcus mictus]